MNKLKFFAIILSAVLMLNLCGCSVFTVDTNELLSPPELSGELAPIAKELNKKAPEGYTLKYPTNGEYRSAVITNDVDGDKIDEAFAFYSTTDDENTYMYINVMINKSGKWKSVDEHKLVAGGVDRVEFSDINTDGVLEILVGWEVYSASEKQVALYSFDGKILSQRMLERYTHYLCADLNDDTESEIFIINFNPAENTNYAALYNLKESGVEEISRCVLDSSVESVCPPILSTLSNGKSAIYIDEIKGAGAITEVVYMDKNVLVNPMLSSNTGQNILTLRSSTIASADMNDDGIIEIPIQSVLPSVFYKEQETLYYTDWYSFNGELLTKQITTIMNFNDGYYLEVPDQYIGKIAILKDINNHMRILYDYNPETETIGEEFIRIQAISEQKWDKPDYKRNGFGELERKDGTVFAYKILASSSEKQILSEQLKSSFKIMKQEAIR